MILTVSKDLFRKRHCYTVNLCNGDGSCSLRGKNGILYGIYMNSGAP